MGMISGGSLISALGTLSGYASAALPVVQAASTIKGVVDSFGGKSDQDAHARLRAQQDLAMKQLKAQQRLGDINAQEESNLARQRIAADAASVEEGRRVALRRAMARQRAQFGAQGIDADDGSGEAVLLGLFQESDVERAQRERLDTLRNRAIDEAMEERSRINVLQRAQLKERHQLDRALAGF